MLAMFTLNQFLHAYLLKKCTAVALKKVCKIMIDVIGNPKMKVWGEEMKNMFRGKCCVLVMCTCVCV